MYSIYEVMYIILYYDMYRVFNAQITSVGEGRIQIQIAAASSGGLALYTCVTNIIVDFMLIVCIAGHAGNIFIGSVLFQLLVLANKCHYIERS